YYYLHIPDCSSIDNSSFLNFYSERTEYFGISCNETLDLALYLCMKVDAMVTGVYLNDKSSDSQEEDQSASSVSQSTTVEATKLDVQNKADPRSLLDVAKSELFSLIGL